MKNVAVITQSGVEFLPEEKISRVLAAFDKGALELVELTDGRQVLKVNVPLVRLEAPVPLYLLPLLQGPGWYKKPAQKLALKALDFFLPKLTQKKPNWVEVSIFDPTSGKLKKL
jgi:hypothetical protein